MTKAKAIELSQLLMPFLVGFAGWAFYQFWAEAKELRTEIQAMRLETSLQIQECRLGLSTLEREFTQHRGRQHEDPRAAQ